CVACVVFFLPLIAWCVHPPGARCGGGGGCFRVRPARLACPAPQEGAFGGSRGIGGLSPPLARECRDFRHSGRAGRTNIAQALRERRRGSRGRAAPVPRRRGCTRSAFYRGRDTCSGLARLGTAEETDRTCPGR